MKKQFLLIITFVVSAIAFSSCFFIGPSIKGNGHVVTQTREISDFKKIKVSTGMEVTLVQSDRELVTVEADENLLDVIRTELKRDELNIFSEERIRKYKKLHITVEFKHLEELRTSSGAQVKSDGMIQVKSLKTSASSGSQQSLSINVRSFDAKASSGAHIRVQGKTDDADFDASSGSHIKAGGVIAENCNAEVSSGAHVYIEVTNSFDGKASSGGHIYYNGNPKSVNIKTSSGGNIKKQ